MNNLWTDINSLSPTRLYMPIQTQTPRKLERPLTHSHGEAPILFLNPSVSFSL